MVELTTINADQAIDSNVKVLDNENTPPPVAIPDGGYGWVIVAAVFLVHVFVLGNLYSFGVFYPVYIDAFNGNKASVAWVGSIGAGLMVGLGVKTGAWADQYGNDRIVFLGGCFVGAGFLLASYATELWHLYLTQGVLAGIGYSLAFIAGVSVVGQWFEKRRGLAVGIAVAGSGLGQFAISLITGKLIDENGWRFALRILALICFAGLIICSLFIKRLIPRIKRVSAESPLVHFQDRNFTLLFLGSLLTSLGMFMPYTHLLIYAEGHGVPKSSAVFILSMVGISSAVGRIMVGLFADMYGRLFMFRVCIFFGGASTLCWMACQTFGQLMAYGIIFGFFAGGVISLTPGVVAELFGIKKLGTVLGALYSSNALGNLLSAPIGGFLYDAYGMYYPSISVAGGFVLSGLIFIYFIDMSTVVKDEAPQSIAKSVDVVVEPCSDDAKTFGYQTISSSDATTQDLENQSSLPTQADDKLVEMAEVSISA